MFSKNGKTTDGHGYQKMSKTRIVYGDLSATDLFANALFGFMRVYVHLEEPCLFLVTFVIHIKQLFKQMVVEYSSPHKDLTSI